MASWQAQLADAYVRAVVRRRDWGSESQLVARARRVFGAPRGYRDVVLSGLRHEVVCTGDGVRGEWICSTDASDHVILYVHGGGYVSCSVATHRPITAALARATGCRIFSLEYRTAPEACFPNAYSDVVAGYRWLTHASKFVTMIGDSAGGGLVLAVAARANSENLPVPSCIAALSPWTDLATTGDSLRTNNGRCAMFHAENIPAFAKVYLAGASKFDPRASPLYADLSRMPPTLLQAGSTEVLLDDARRFHERMIASARSSTLSIYEDVIHGWQLLAPFLPEARTAVAEIAEFVRTHFGLR